MIFLTIFARFIICEIKLANNEAEKAFNSRYEEFYKKNEFVPHSCIKIQNKKSNEYDLFFDNFIIEKGNFILDLYNIPARKKLETIKIKVLKKIGFDDKHYHKFWKIHLLEKIFNHYLETGELSIENPIGEKTQSN